MARTAWKGAIEFGIVVFMVRLYLATELKGVAFHLLHASCGSRIQMKIWCPVHGAAITRAETVKGYEYATDECVSISDADLEAVPLKTVHAIEIEGFSAAAEVAPWARYAKQTYYVAPEPIGLRAASLLASVLAKRRLVAVCKVVLTNREHLALLDAVEGALMLTTVCWPDEVRPAAEAALPAVPLKPAERAMADQLVSAMTVPFDPAAYKDEYRAALTAVIERKVAGLAPAGSTTPQRAGTIVDLMAALEASVAAARAKAAASASAVSTTEPTARRARQRPSATAASIGSREAPPSPEPSARGGHRRRPAA